MLSLNIERNMEVERSLESKSKSSKSISNNNDIMDRRFYDDLVAAEKVMDKYVFSMVLLGWNPEDIKSEYFGVSLEAADAFVEAYKEYDKELVLKHCEGLFKCKQFKALLGL